MKKRFIVAALGILGASFIYRSGLISMEEGLSAPSDQQGKSPEQLQKEFADRADFLPEYPRRRKIRSRRWG